MNELRIQQMMLVDTKKAMELSEAAYEHRDADSGRGSRAERPATTMLEKWMGRSIE